MTHPIHRLLQGMLLLFVGIFSANSLANVLPGSKSSASLPFVENQGQVSNPNVAFTASTFAGKLFVKKTPAWVYQLVLDRRNTTGKYWAFEERMMSAQSSLPQGVNKSSAHIQIFKGNNAQWQTNLAAYETVRYENVYPGIDVELAVTGNNIEKLFVIEPGADVSDIKLTIDGVNALALEKNQLVLHTSMGEIKFTAPVAYQLINDQKQMVDVSYALVNNQYGFKVGEYDNTQPLVIDPLLASTFLGGSNDNAYSDFERAEGIAKYGNSVYVAGVTDSSDFPTQLGLNTAYQGGGYDGFVAKVSADLSTLESATFLGGSSYDDIWGLKLDSAGNVYVVGRTGGTGFPLTAGSYRYSAAVTSGTFLAKFDSSLTQLKASALIAGSTLPADLHIGNNSIYVGGRTNRPVIPVTPNAYDTTCGRDGLCDPSGSYGLTKYYGYLERLNLNLDSLLAATYLGEEGGASVRVGSNGLVYIIDQSSVNGTALAGLDDNLTTKVASISYSYGINFTALDVSDSFVAASGNVRSNQLQATGNAFDTTCGTDGNCDPVGTSNYATSDTFVASYSLDLVNTLALSYFGGSDEEYSHDIVINDVGNIIMTGVVKSLNMPVSSNAVFPQYSGNQDGFIAAFDTSLGQLLYGSYIGGSQLDQPNKLLDGGTDQIYVAGSTGSLDFPITANAYDTSYNGGDVDVFIALFDVSGLGGGGSGGNTPANQAPVANAGQDQIVGSRDRVYLNGSQSSDSDGEILGYHWKQIAGKQVSLKNANSKIAKFRSPRLRRGKQYILQFELTVTDDQGASDKDTVTIYVR